jgi:hypothetical protein
MSVFSRMRQPWSITRWPMLTLRSSVTAMPPSVWITDPSCTFTFSPRVMRSLSPRMATLNQTLAFGSMTTLPMTAALGAT